MTEIRGDHKDCVILCEVLGQKAAKVAFFVGIDRAYKDRHNYNILTNRGLNEEFRQRSMK